MHRYWVRKEHRTLYYMVDRATTFDGLDGGVVIPNRFTGDPRVKFKRGQLVSHPYAGLGIVNRIRNHEGYISVLVYWLETQQSHTLINERFLSPLDPQETGE